MRYSRVLISSVFLCATLSQAQIASDAPVKFDQSHPVVDTAQLDALLHATRPILVFAPQDTLSFKIYGLKDYDTESVQVAQDGTIVLPLVGKLHVAGITLEELDDLVRSRLITTGTITDPQFNLTVLKRPSDIVTVSGDVGKPGVFPAEGNLTLLDYLSQAVAFGELNQYPAVPPPSSTVTLVRPGLPAPVNIPLGPDAQKSPYGRIPIFPGDQIMVGKLGLVYAVGALKQQGSYPLKADSPTTVMQLIALAGGIGYEADRKDAHIVRTIGASRYLLPVDVGLIIEGKAPDVPLMSDDILFVPTNDLKAAIKGGGSGLIVSLASALIYTH